MTYSYQIALIVPAAQREAAKRIAEAMGWGPDNYRVPLSDGAYYGLSAVAQPSFIDALAAAGSGTAPEGVDPADLEAVLPVLLSSIEPQGTRAQADQFDALCAQHGLSRAFEPGA